MSISIVTNGFKKVNRTVKWSGGWGSIIGSLFWVGLYFAFVIAIYLGLGWLLVESLNYWLIFAGRAASSLPIWAAALLVACVPYVGRLAIPVYVLTWILITWIL